MSVIGLALLALVIATLVWLFERMRVEDSGATGTAELEAISPLEDEVFASGPPLASNDKAEGNVTTLWARREPINEQFRENPTVDQ